MSSSRKTTEPSGLRISLVAVRKRDGVVRGFAVGRVVALDAHGGARSVFGPSRRSTLLFNAGTGRRSQAASGSRCDHSTQHIVIYGG